MNYLTNLPGQIHLIFPIVRKREFSHPMHKTFGNLWENKKNSDSAWALLVYLGKFMKHKSELLDKINQLVISSDI